MYPVFTKFTLLLPLLSGLVFAQSASTGALNGTVTDPSNAVLAGASIQITNPETQFAREIATDDAGFYRFDLLPPGTYDIKATQKGFAPGTMTGISVKVGSAVTQNIARYIRASARARSSRPVSFRSTWPP